MPFVIAFLQASGPQPEILESGMSRGWSVAIMVSGFASASFAADTDDKLAVTVLSPVEVIATPLSGTGGDYRDYPGNLQQLGVAPCSSTEA